MSLPERFLAALEKDHLIRRGEKIAVACSGGPDSVALFLLLDSLRRPWRLKLSLLHIDHGLRGRESAADARFVRALARRSGVPFHGLRTGAAEKRKLPARLSPEEAARSLRYAAFRRLASRHRLKKLALAHTRDDQAETVLMRLLQGTGLRGLGGIRRRLRLGSLELVRPLLAESKKDLAAWLREQGVRARTDRTNRSRRFLRNRIRLDVLPYLCEQVNPKAVEALSRLPGILEDENRLLEELEDRSWKQVYLGRRRERVRLDREHFLACPDALRFRLLDRALKKLDALSGLDWAAWNRLRPGLAGGRVRVSLARAIDLSLTSDTLVLCKKGPDA